MSRTPGQFLAIGSGAVIAMMLIGVAGFKFVDVSTETSRHDVLHYAQPIRHIDVDSATVSLVGTPGNSVTVGRTISEGLGRPAPHAELVGDTLRLSGGCAGFLLAHCGIKYTITVPATTDIGVHDASGTVSASGMRADLSLTAESGQLSASDIRGSVSMSADSGQISIDSVRGDTVSLRADSGRISASGIAAKTFTADADSGSIDAEFSSDPTTVTTRADSGSIDIAVPPDGTDYDLTGVGAGSGRFDINEVRARTGAPHKIIANAPSGRISVRYSR